MSAASHKPLKRQGHTLDHSTLATGSSAINARMGAATPRLGPEAGVCLAVDAMGLRVPCGVGQVSPGLPSAQQGADRGPSDVGRCWCYLVAVAQRELACREAMSLVPGLAITRRSARTSTADYAMTT